MLEGCSSVIDPASAIMQESSWVLLDSSYLDPFFFSVALNPNTSSVCLSKYSLNVLETLQSMINMKESPILSVRHAGEDRKSIPTPFFNELLQSFKLCLIDSTKRCNLYLVPDNAVIDLGYAFVSGVAKNFLHQREIL